MNIAVIIAVYIVVEFTVIDMDLLAAVKTL